MISATLLALPLLAPLQQSPLPYRLTLESRLFDSSGIAVNAVDLGLTVRIYKNPNGGQPVFEEVLAADVSDGFFAVPFGANPTTGVLDADLFRDNPELFLGLTVDGDVELSPRLPLLPIHSALRADTARTADSVTGPVDATEISVGGAVVVDSSGTWVGDPTGLVGPAGPEGPQGPIGPIGPEGPAGNDGATGPEGPQGPIGLTGPEGPAGPQGLQGPTGPAGSDGAVGPEGPQGPIGPIGPEGPAGNDGATGPEGPAGPAGNDGAPGPIGPVGPEGPQGPAGPEGPEGPEGPQGPAGSGAFTEIGGERVQYTSTTDSSTLELLPGVDNGNTSGAAALLAYTTDGADGMTLTTLSGFPSGDAGLSIAGRASGSDTPARFTVLRDSLAVGLGTSSPQSALHVADDSSVQLRLEADQDNNGENDQPTMLFSQDGGAIRTSIGYHDAANDFELRRLASDDSVEAFIRLQSDGRVQVDSIEVVGGADLAEPFETVEAELEPGTVVVIDSERVGRLRESDAPYDFRVAGVVSGARGVEPGLTLSQHGVLEGEAQVALVGRVYVKASAENGAIRAGDLLTTSSTPGHAMRSTDRERAPGAVIGKAMGTLDEGTGYVLVLINLQ